MNRNTKEKIVVNVIIDMVVIIFIIFLIRYNQKLYAIQEEYSSIIIQALEIIKEPNYFYYFLGGLMAGIALVAISVWDFKQRNQIEILIVGIMILFNCILLIVLLIVYSNPIFTAFAIVASGAGLYMAVQQ